MFMLSVILVCMGAATALALPVASSGQPYVWTLVETNYPAGSTTTSEVITYSEGEYRTRPTWYKHSMSDPAHLSQYNEQHATTITWSDRVPVGEPVTVTEIFTAI